MAATKTAAPAAAPKSRLVSSDPQIGFLTFSSREEWEQERCNGIGASSVAALMGISGYKDANPLSVYQHILGFTKTKPSWNMQLGHYMEPVIAKMFADKTGAIMMEESEPDFIVCDTAHPWRRVSPDRFYWPSGTPVADQTYENARLLEIKYVSKRDEGKKYGFIKLSTENFAELYPEYIAQVQYQMGVCKKSEATILFVDKTDMEFKPQWFTIEAKPKYYQHMCDNVLDPFWHNHIEALVEPECETPDEGNLQSRYPMHIPGSRVTADEELARQAIRYSAIGKLMLKLKKEQDGIKNALKEVMQENETLVAPDSSKLCTWRYQPPKKVFDTEAFMHDNMVEYEKYLVEKSVDRKFDFDSVSEAQILSVLTESELEIYGNSPAK